jgi:hypothetical protein
MKTDNYVWRIVALSFLVIGGFLMTSCEDDKKTVYIYENVPTSSGSSNSSGGYNSSSPTSGKWSGVSATGQVSTSLSLSESGGSISGSLKWPGDSRSVSGSHSGSSVTLHIGGGDTWKLSYSGTKLSGTGYKAGGGTYSVSLNRK